MYWGLSNYISISSASRDICSNEWADNNAKINIYFLIITVI